MPPCDRTVIAASSPKHQGCLLVCSRGWVWLSPGRCAAIISTCAHLPLRSSMLVSLMKIPLGGLSLWAHMGPRDDFFQEGSVSFQHFPENHIIFTVSSSRPDFPNSSHIEDPAVLLRGVWKWKTRSNIFLPHKPSGWVLFFSFWDSFFRVKAWRSQRERAPQARLPTDVVRLWWVPVQFARWFLLRVSKIMPWRHPSLECFLFKVYWSQKVELTLLRL